MDSLLLSNDSEKNLNEKTVRVAAANEILSDAEITNYRAKINDPDYMKKAINSVADRFLGGAKVACKL